MLSNYYHYYHYYSYPRLLVLLLSLLLLLQPQASITYSYWIFIAITILSTISQLPLLLPLYITIITITYYLLYYSLLATIYHRQKKKTLLYIFERYELFLQFCILYSPLTFYSVMRCLLLLPSTHSATGNFLMGAETTDTLLQKKTFAKRGNLYVYVNWKWKKLPW